MADTADLAQASASQPRPDDAQPRPDFFQAWGEGTTATYTQRDGDVMWGIRGPFARHVRMSWTDPTTGEHTEQPLGPDDLFAVDWPTPAGEAAGQFAARLALRGMRLEAAPPFAPELAAALREAAPTEQAVRQQILALADAIEATGAGSLRPPLRKPSRPVRLPFQPGALLPMVNVLNNGTRNHGLVVTGAAQWQVDPNMGATFALLGGERVGRIDLGKDGEEEAHRLIAALGPRTLKVMVAVTALVIERTRNSTEHRVAVVNVRELAEAAGYKPDSSRHIDPELLQRLGQDLKALARVQTFAADGGWNKKAGRAASGWLAPLLTLNGVHIKQDGPNGEELPYEVEVVLGRNWSEALTQGDGRGVMQLMPGFMDLDPAEEPQALKLAWFYLTDFRYRLAWGPRKHPIPIERICAIAGLDFDRNNLRRSLLRFDRWHCRLTTVGILGGYTRVPEWLTADGDVAPEWTPREVLAKGAYAVTTPSAILEAYGKGTANANAGRAQSQRRKMARRKATEAELGS